MPIITMENMPRHTFSLGVETENMRTMLRLKENPYIRSKDCGNHIRSYNFTREAFWRKHWDEQTVTARGLFVDTRNGSVYARSYNKFFNMDERPETQYNHLREKLSYPVDVFRKENGYLGIVSVHNGVPEFFSKSTNGGPYAETLRQIATYETPLPEEFYQYLEENHYSAVFEVIEVDVDRHFVQYDHNQLVLLDLVKNTYDFKTLPYEELYALCQKWGITCKLQFDRIENKEEFDTKIAELEHVPYIEGYVFVDQNNNMFKLKTCWYRFWKAIRSRGQYVYKHLGLYSYLDVPSHHDLDRKRELHPIADEALKYYAFARNAGLECPHVMDVMDFMEQTSLQDLSVVI